MFTLAVATLKGGAGKTTTSLSLAGAWAKRGKRVVFIDSDPQATSTRSFRLAELAAPWQGEAVGFHPEMVRKPILVYRSGRPLETAEPEQMLEHVAREVDADIVVIDTPPLVVNLPLAAMSVADLVLVPIDASPYGYEGFEDTLKLVERVSPPPPIRVVLTMADRTKVTREVASLVEENHPGVLCTTQIPRDTKARETPFFGLPLTLYDPQGRAGSAYFALAKELQALMKSGELSNTAAMGERHG